MFSDTSLSTAVAETEMKEERGGANEQQCYHHTAKDERCVNVESSP